ncbi:MAG: hypothetical protein ABFS37_10930 [Acidobacteriota bacterium]
MKTDSDPKPWLHALYLIRWPAVAIVILIIGWLSIQSALQVGKETTLEVVDRAAEAINQLGVGFTSTTITETFTASIPQLGTEGMLLEVAQLEATETFERRDEKRAFYDLVPLGVTVSEIRVPVTYRYHLRLEDPWTLDVREGICLVHAPTIRPTKPPAIHTDGMEKRIEDSWLRFDEAEVMDELEQSLSLRLSARAGSPQRIDLVRETCRVRVADFVRSWLLAEEQWGQGRIIAVDVVFADEATRDLQSPLPPQG